MSLKNYKAKRKFSGKGKTSEPEGSVKKSDKKLWLLTLEEPEKFEFMRDMENKYQHVKPNKDGKPRVFFRKHRSVDDLFKEAELMDELTIPKEI